LKVNANGHASISLFRSMVSVCDGKTPFCQQQTILDANVLEFRLSFGVSAFSLLGLPLGFLRLLPQLSSTPAFCNANKGCKMHFA
jgi:hypothetical protein